MESHTKSTLSDAMGVRQLAHSLALLRATGPGRMSVHWLCSLQNGDQLVLPTLKSYASVRGRPFGGAQVLPPRQTRRYDVRHKTKQLSEPASTVVVAVAVAVAQPTIGGGAGVDRCAPEEQDRIHRARSLTHVK